MKKFLVIGTGDSSIHQSKLGFDIPGDVITIGMHRVFPNLTDSSNLKLDYWTYADPDAAIDGFRLYMSKNHTMSNYKMLPQIVLPYYFRDLEIFNINCGTSPLYKNPDRDDDREFYKRAIDTLDVAGKITWIDNAINTKTIPPTHDIHSRPANRFKGENTYFGSVPFDGRHSESHWAQENKFTAFMLPIVHFLGATHVFCVGYDTFGKGIGRDFDFAHNNPRIILNYLSKYPKWTRDWVKYHNMDIYNVAEEKFTPTSMVMQNIPFSEIANINTEVAGVLEANPDVDNLLLEVSNIPTKNFAHSNSRKKIDKHFRSKLQWKK